MAIVTVINCYLRPTDLPTCCCSVSLTVFNCRCSLTPPIGTLNCKCITESFNGSYNLCHHCCSVVEHHSHIAILVAITVAQVCDGFLVSTLKHACLTNVILCTSSELATEQVHFGKAFGKGSLLYMLTS